MKKMITLQTCTIKTLCAIFFGLFLVTSCVEPEEPIKPKPPIDNPMNYPVDIPFTEFSLEGIQCEWANLAYDGKVIIINNKEEMEKYINSSCRLSEIDFSKYTLLVANGSVNSGLIKTALKDLQQLSPSDYQLAVEIIVFESIVSENWAKALLVEKLSDESNVELHIIEEQWPIGLELGYYKEIYPWVPGYRGFTISFYDRENLTIWNNVLTVGSDFKYEIIQDSIKLRENFPNTTFKTYYFNIINATKFEIDFLWSMSPDSVYYIFEKTH
jgi:hypothetical protein